MAIKLPQVSSNSNPISIRIDNKLLEDINDVVKQIKTLTGKEDAISRNQLIELMLKYARDNATIEINGNEMTFEQILEG